MSNAASSGGVDLTGCDREPIHVPGSIQPHGALVVWPLAEPRIVQVSANLEDVLAVPPANVVGHSLAAALGEELAAEVEAMARQAGEAQAVQRRFGWRAPSGAALSLAVHRSGELAVLELEPSPPEPQPDGQTLTLVEEATASLRQAGQMDELARAAVRLVRRITGFDRVMMYQFLADGSGTVIAEERPETEPAYLGLHYPASDIPQQARALYRRNWLRLIPDIEYRPAPLTPAALPGGRSLDMTYCSLRSVSPVHLEYLRNMGVQASMSISILRRGELWGLIACHHRTPHHLPARLRSVCELFGQILSLQLDAREELDLYDQRLRSKRVQGILRDELAGGGRLEEQLLALQPKLAELIQADGMAILIGDQRHRVGVTPTEKQIELLVGWLGEHHPDGVFATTSLARAYLAAERFAAEASGLLAVPLPENPGDYLLFFRRELPRTVLWGGDPTKPVEVAEGQRLSPRKSFAAWQQLVRLTARPWDEHELDAAETLRSCVLQLALERARDRERREADAHHQQQLMAELDHRVKNTLAMIRSLVLQGRTHAGSLESFVPSLEGRIRALAHAHELLTAERWQGGSLRRLLAAELAPHSGAGAGAAEILGTDVMLRPKAVIAAIMVVHELVANAVAHGALSVPAGRVRIELQIDPASGGLLLRWREQGGPHVPASPRRGFGATVIERTFRFELGGSTELRFAPGGVEVDMLIPSRHLLRIANEPPEPVRPAGGAAKAAGDAVGQGRVLIVEDQMIVALDLEGIVQQLGYHTLGPASTVEEARSFALAGNIDFAILDVNLNDRYVFEVADLLMAKDVPFFFATGYGRQEIIPPHLRGAPLVTKPYDPAAIRQAMDDLRRGKS